MTPDQFLRQVSKGEPEAAYLFLGPDLYRRDRCRKALIERFLPPEDREQGYVRHDLDEINLAEVLDDLNSLSLFAGRRIVWAGAADSVVPKGRASAEDESQRLGDALNAYLKNPAPSTVLVLDSSREFGYEDRTKLERMRKFFSGIPSVVEFNALDAGEARHFALAQAKEAGLTIPPAQLEILVDAVGADASRIAHEIEKLALYAKGTGSLSVEDITALVPDAREATIFNLVDAITGGDRTASLNLLDTLVRAGEYLPLALTFVGGVFRLALAARIQGLRSASEIQSYFQRQGVAMWRSKAEQIAQVSARMSLTKLRHAIEQCFVADRDMKSTRPDDRLVMERFLLEVTK